MPELAEPLTPLARGMQRLDVIQHLVAERARLDALLRVELTGLVLEDTPFGMRRYLCNEVAPALAESPGTADRWLIEAQMFTAHPAVMARVGLPLHEGGWTIRHADALLSAISGLGLAERVQEQVVQLVTDHPDARTPHQIRKAAQAAVMVLDPEGAERRLARARANRRVGADTLGDGSGSFWACGTASQVAAVMASIDCLAGPKRPGDERSLDQRRFDAFMDLICGRTVPGQWQALVVVSLETLTGQSEDPAEIPGYGLIPASEARDLAAHADLRRAVVDEHGELVSIDSQVHHPDLPDAVRLDQPHPHVGLSLETEPEPLDTTPENPPSEADLIWLAQHDQHDQQHATVAVVVSTLDAELTALLTTHALIPVGRGDWSTPWTRIEISRWTHGPEAGPADGAGDGPGDGPGEGGSDSGEGQRAPEPEPAPAPGREPDDSAREEPAEPDPPSLDDQLWAEATLDRQAQDALEPPPRYEREPWTPYARHTQPAPRWTSWTRLGLTAALAKVTRAPIDPQPLTSTAYALPPRMARFVKHRDITCSFPGCRRLAWSTENDHLLPWPHGSTTCHNIDCKCKHHHQAKTHGGYQTIRLPGGGIRWTTPLGRTYDRGPRPLLRGF